jgi:hypothetical protein
VSSLFCRHNRFTADCPICAKGTVLDPGRSAERPRARSSSRSGGAKRGGQAAGSRTFSGPHVAAGPYGREDGSTYEVRLEKVPGGIRLAQWSRGSLEKAAPELPAADVPALVVAAIGKELLEGRDAEALGSALNGNGGDGGDEEGGFGASEGRAGDMREQLRVDRLPEGRVRVGRWLFWPGRGWELQEAPPMFPAARYAEALSQAAGRGLLRA